MRAASTLLKRTHLIELYFAASVNLDIGCLRFFAEGELDVGIAHIIIVDDVFEFLDLDQVHWERTLNLRHSLPLRCVPGCVLSSSVGILHDSRDSSRKNS